MHTRQSSTQNNKYQVSHKYSCFSWWWAHSCPKHGEERNKRTKKNCASSWLYLQDYTRMQGQQNTNLCLFWQLTTTSAIVSCMRSGMNSTKLICTLLQDMKFAYTSNEPQEMGALHLFSVFCLHIAGCNTNMTTRAHNTSLLSAWKIKNPCHFTQTAKS
jgi:hypothetical protein